MKKNILLIFFIIYFSTNSFLFGQDKNFLIDKLKNHIEFLASDSLKGRKPGTEESNIAANYIAKELHSYGFESIGNSSLQHFDILSDLSIDTTSSLTIGNKEYVLNKDFTPMYISSSGEFAGDIVFAGFGITEDTKKLKLDSYKDINAKGKWAIILDGEPKEEAYKSNFHLNYKILNAEDHGAKGVLYVKSSYTSRKGLPVKGRFSRSLASANIPVISISQSLANKLLEKYNTSIDTLAKRIIESKETKSFPLDLKATAYVKLNRNIVETQNVIAKLEGNDPLLKNEYIVIGAHYDHLGFGGKGSGSRMPDTIAIHNGADDNASGVAGILELARTLSLGKENLKRSVIIMAFGAEEMGLIGSKFYTKNSLIDNNKIKAMVNFDMIGRLDEEKNSIMVAGTKTSEEAESLLNQYKENTNLNVAFSPEGYGASDHASFYAEKIPVFFFSTGAHSDYHTPFDDADRINYKGMLTVLDYTDDIVLDLLNRDNGLTFKESGFKPRTSGRMGLKVKLGIMPDFTSTENKGLNVGGVTKGGPAHQGGMLKDDIITTIEGKTVKNIYDYMERLKKLKVGQNITVDIMRKGEHKVLIISL
ncbi:MAG: M20/M25/M40 family metallo-hydrolase [Hyphomicrobiales bacterium]